MEGNSGGRVRVPVRCFAQTGLETPLRIRKMEAQLKNEKNSERKEELEADLKEAAEKMEEEKRHNAHQKEKNRNQRAVRG